MNRLLFCLLSLLALLNTTTHATIWARKLWVKNDTGQVVEVWYDIHAQFLSKELCTQSKCPETEQQKLLNSNQIPAICTQQKRNTIAYAQLYKKNIHLYLEDLGSVVKSMGYPVTGVKYCYLTGLATLAKKAQIPYTNLEFRYPGVDYKSHKNKIYNYKDSPQLTEYYITLKRIANDLKLNTENHYLFNAILAHNIFIGTNKGIPRQIFIGGASHGLALSIALPLMGFACDEEKTVIHPDLQRILYTPKTESEYIVQQLTQLFLGASLQNFIDERTMKTENRDWASAFLTTNPIDISTFRARDETIDKQRVQAETKTAATSPSSPAAPAPPAPSRPAAPVPAAPVTPLRSRL